MLLNVCTRTYAQHTKAYATGKKFAGTTHTKTSSRTHLTSTKESRRNYNTYTTHNSTPTHTLLYIIQFNQDQPEKKEEGTAMPTQQHTHTHCCTLTNSTKTSSNAPFEQTKGKKKDSRCPHNIQ